MRNLLWFIPLFFAWTCVEFLLFPFIERKHWKRLVTHVSYALLHAAAAYIFCLQWEMWMLLPLMAVVHGVIFFLPEATWRQAFFRCSLQTAALIALVIWLPFPAFSDYFLRAFSWLLWAASGVIVVVLGAGKLVGLAMAELAADNGVVWQGLNRGGLWIGRLERLLIFLFMVVGLPAGIGFLVAAKSVLRFGETRENQKLAEYVLIGTFASFSIGIAGSAIVLRGIAILKNFIA